MSPSIGCLFAVFAAQPTEAEFFETRIRPVLVSKCFECHSAEKHKGGLVLDTRAGLRKGGTEGPVVIAGKPDESPLIRALGYADPLLEMPPGGPLPQTVVDDFRRWIAAGAFDPRPDLGPVASASGSFKGMSVEEGRRWWSFQPVEELPAPKVRAVAWRRTKTDAFVLSKLEGKGLRPSPPADRRTLVQRAYVDLVGFKPTFAEVEAFVGERAPDAYEKLVDRLLASPHHGERWARHWMDVARYGDDNPTAEATSPPYPSAWRYRDWIIEALNQDVPYDRFIKLQLAADKMPETTRQDLRALGYLGAAPVYHKDQRLSADVVGTLLADDWDDRIDALGRGILGLSIACARCHDHKFDPIKQRDYYALQGVFASTMRIERPMFDVDPAVERRYLWVQRRLFDLNYAVRSTANEFGTVKDAAVQLTKWMTEIRALQAEMTSLLAEAPLLARSLEPYYTFTRHDGRENAIPAKLAGTLGFVTVPRPPEKDAGSERPFVAGSQTPFMNIVCDAATYVDGSDKDYTWLRYVPDEPRDMPLLKAGNVASPGPVVPRGFPAVLAKDDGRFTQGSGRLELAETIFGDAQSLTARVAVNRIWAWHFGQGLVSTPSDFGVQGERATHPELLGDLAARFIAHGWSLKWLHREIMLSAAYRQANRFRPRAHAGDPTNKLLWRLAPRRMDAEAYRDSLLRAAGVLTATMYGPSQDVDDPGNHRRSVYGRVSRYRPATFLTLFDFPDPMQSAPAREQTTSPLQQLFVLNGDLIHKLSLHLAAKVEDETTPVAKARALFRRILAREPTTEERRRAIAFLKHGAVEVYAQALLATNEEILWP